MEHASSHPSTLTNHEPITLDIPTRSGSPTPSEIEEMNEPFINLNFRRFITLDFISQPKNILIIVIIALTVAGGILIGVKHTQAEALFRPTAVWMKDAPGGWLIPVAILFIISFPPLFGHEVVAILCGDVWGLWIGFALVTLGSTLGEIGNFYAFKYMCSARGDKLERTSWLYACLARTVRDGGFFVALIARLSAIPGHFVTAVFSTAGMNFVIFVIAAVLSSPKQFVAIYIGVVLERSSATGDPPSKESNIVSDVAVVITVLTSIGSGLYMWRKMHAARIMVVRERRARRAMKMKELDALQHEELGAWDGKRARTVHFPLQRGMVGDGLDLRHSSTSTPVLSRKPELETEADADLEMGEVLTQPPPYASTSGHSHVDERLPDTTEPTSGSTSSDVPLALPPSSYQPNRAISALDQTYEMQSRSSPVVTTTPKTSNSSPFASFYNTTLGESRRSSNSRTSRNSLETTSVGYFFFWLASIIIPPFL